MVTDDGIAETLIRIKHDAPAQQVDFRDPENAFTVWAGFYPFMKYCEHWRTLDSAWILASEHVNQKDLYIANAKLSPHGIMEFERQHHRYNSRMDTATLVAEIAAQRARWARARKN